MSQEFSMEGINPEKERLFGTGGIRGTPGQYPLTDGMVFKIGIGIAKLILYQEAKEGKNRVIIGKDTSNTSLRLETILCDAIRSYGIDVALTGVITTPALSYLVKRLGASMGIMISASHNRLEDNGIKIFNAQGYKLFPEEEEWIEEIVFSSLIHKPNGDSNKKKGNIEQFQEVLAPYREFLVSTMDGERLDSLTVALNCTWRIPSPFVKELLESLGASVYTIDYKPQDNGDIASCLRKELKDSSVDIGIILDGDAGRVTLLDEQGNFVDGDTIMAILAEYLLEKKKLAKNTIVATVMSNLGLKVSLESNGGSILLTKVGIKHVMQELVKNDLNLGGEQSGRIIMRDYLPTADGLLVALQILKIIKETGQPLSVLAECIIKLPQILVNVNVREKRPFDQMPILLERLRFFAAQVKDKGRILLRYSGTESVARVMVEGGDKDLIHEIAHALASHIREEIGMEEVM